ncbi:hypothetical protein WQ57_11060 [Mesobacillus campisalis]|uniref:Uncharacterized protein n=1 Tax=Mesobacillus campisalis TaxID=1408103 RepID=A0A0M2SYH1_9BACI|nr:hypothetical protein WQ57_11060 [Mesobacillus campisalis]
MLLPEELKFVEFLGGEARQAPRAARGKRSAWNENQQPVEHSQNLKLGIRDVLVKIGREREGWLKST